MKKQAMRAWFVGLTMLAMLGLLASASFAQGSETNATAAKEDSYVFLPMVTYVGTPPSLPFRDDFGPDMSPDWKVFTLPGGPFANDWKWQGKGYYWYFPGEIGDEDRWTRFALSMLLGEDSQTWTDYEVVATLRDDYRRGGKGLTGLWFRGTYQNGVIGGYYAHIKPDNSMAYLWRLPPGSRSLDDAKLVPNGSKSVPDLKFLTWYSMKVQVQGARIRVWLKLNSAPESDYALLFDWTDPDPTYTEGTIGLSAYKSKSIYDRVVVSPLSAGSQ